MLNVTINVSNSLYLWCYIYDNDGTTLLISENSNATKTISKDGLAAGTYYIKLVAYYTGQLPAYTISNTLTVPAQANDAEPNDTKAQAKVLPLNGKKTGHTGYYYHNQRDTSDWYKITTNADGLLRLSLTPANSRYVWIYLYDNNGTTLLNSGNSNKAFSVDQDGLAAGTYYVRVKTYYNTEFAPYTLTDSLFEPAQANDIEPNDTKAQAKVLPLNGRKTGHAGYYYNNLRDTSDWYKVTTSADGLLRLFLTPANGNYVWIYLYDNNGTTLLNSDNSNKAFTVNQDGLASGTYYVRIKTYYNTQFAPYTLSDSLITYNNTADEEPNKQPYNAKTISANGTVKGHVGFYYNNARDSVDWWKINYTGSGNLNISINQEAWKLNNTQHYVWIKVYKDTLSNPIYSDNSNAANWVVNLSNLTQGYYYVKIYAYYGSEFIAYSITASFTQVTKAKIGVKEFSTPASCDDNYIKVNPYNGNGPFAVQLYRFGVAYGGLVNVKKGSTKKFDNLPAGSYYAIAYADGATGNAFGKSPTITIEPVPADLTTQNITKYNAELTWSLQPCASYYVVKYRKQGTTTWKNKQTVGNINNYKATGLTPNTTYEWVVATADSANNIIAKSDFANSVVFTTNSAGLIAQDELDEDDASAASILHNIPVSVSPNPATNFFVIHYNNDAKEKVSASLYDMNGKLIWNSGTMNADALNGKQVSVSQFGSGLYYLKLTNDKNVLIGGAKIVINK
jgi:hypothetical protein